jgi:hypothetical protein
MTFNNLVASVDASAIKVGSAVVLNVKAKSLINNVTVQNPPPVAVNVDIRAKIDLTVQVVNARGVVPGWTITNETTNCVGAAARVTPCVVTFDGPASWESGLKASASYPNAVEGRSTEWPSAQITLAEGPDNTPLDPTVFTIPQVTLKGSASGQDVSTVTIQIDAKTGTTFNTVPLVDAPPLHGPPPGYQIVGIHINPTTLTITGDQAILGTIPYIRLPAVDLSSWTSTVSIQVNIPYRPGVSSIDNITTATITYQIVRNPAVSPSP